MQLTDDVQLIEQVGELRWREWGYGETSREDWIRISAAGCGRTDLPMTLVALDDDGAVLGAVGLGDGDDALTTEERRDRAPWLLGLVVNSAHRQEGIGRELVRASERKARERGFSRVWVSTGDDAVSFYLRCGWTIEEHLVLAKGGWTNHVLAKRLG